MKLHSCKGGYLSSFTASFFQTFIKLEASYFELPLVGWSHIFSCNTSVSAEISWVKGRLTDKMQGIMQGIVAITSVLNVKDETGIFYLDTDEVALSRRTSEKSNSSRDFSF